MTPAASAFRAVPSSADVRTLPLALSGAVVREDVDVNGHLNLLRILHHCFVGIDAVLEPLGLTAEYRGVQQRSFFTAEQHVTYVAEQMLDDAFSVYVRVLGVSGKVLHTVSYMLNDDRDALAAFVEVMAIHVDLTTRRSVPMPARMHTGLVQLAEASAATSWDAGDCGSMGIRPRG